MLRLYLAIEKPRSISKQILEIIGRNSSDESSVGKGKLSLTTSQEVK